MADFWENNEIDRYCKEFTEFLNDGIASDIDVPPDVDSGPVPVPVLRFSSTNFNGREHRMKILAGVLGHSIVFT
jgi:hypothetical protein